jgi:hypothetical protein
MLASRSHENRTKLQHEQRSSGEWRQLRARNVAKLATLRLWLAAARQGGRGPSVALERAVWWRLP